MALWELVHIEGTRYTVILPDTPTPREVLAVATNTGLVEVGQWLGTRYELPYTVQIVDSTSDFQTVVTFRRLRGRSPSF